MGVDTTAARWQITVYLPYVLLLFPLTQARLVNLYVKTVTKHIKYEAEQRLYQQDGK